MHPTFCLWLIVVLVQWSAFPNRSDGWLSYAVLSLYRRRIAFVHCLETAIIARLYFFRDGAKRSSISLHFPHNLIVVLRRRSSLDSFRIEMRGLLVSGRRSSLVLSELQLPSSSSRFDRVHRSYSSSIPNSSSIVVIVPILPAAILILFRTPALQEGRGETMRARDG